MHFVTEAAAASLWLQHGITWVVARWCCDGAITVQMCTNNRLRSEPVRQLTHVHVCRAWHSCSSLVLLLELSQPQLTATSTKQMTGHAHPCWGRGRGGGQLFVRSGLCRQLPLSCSQVLSNLRLRLQSPKSVITLALKPAPLAGVAAIQ